MSDITDRLERLAPGLMAHTAFASSAHTVLEAAEEIKALLLRLDETTKEAEAQRKCADAYFNALCAVRGALDLSDDDDHLFVLGAIERLKSRLAACEKERDEERLGKLCNGDAALEHWNAIQAMKISIKTLEAKNKGLVGRLDDYRQALSRIVEHYHYPGGTLQPAYSIAKKALAVERQRT